MDDKAKRPLVDTEGPFDGPETKQMKKDSTETTPKYANLKHGKGRPVPIGVLEKLTSEEVELLEQVKTSCVDLTRIEAAMQLRVKYRLSLRLPEDVKDATYYVENGLRKVHPYYYLYQSYAKRRWLGRKLRDVIMKEFRDISDESLKSRFENKKILVGGKPANFEHVLRDNDFISSLTHRHELPVLATPIKVIYQDKDTFVIDKPPSIPIHPCGRFRHNSISNILLKEYGINDLKIVHRLDRLVSGVLIMALNSRKAHEIESMIKNRDVQKEYVCRVEGEFPLGDSDDGEIIVDQPLDTIPGKIGVVVVIPEGKPSLTKFKRLNYNGKTSAVLCKPLTGRMHQIRVHLQYLGHPIVNDSMYNCTSFGPEKGKGGRYGKSLKQLSDDVLEKHRASSWLMGDQEETVEMAKPEDCDFETRHLPDPIKKTAKFLSEEERKETMDALAHYFTEESWSDLEEKFKVDASKLVPDKTCRDCQENFHDPPLRGLYLYLHALKYSGANWSYESEIPVWAKDNWLH